MPDLHLMKCVPCHGQIPSLTMDEITSLLPQVGAWSLVEERGELRLQRRVKTPGFRGAIKLANQIAEMAEVEDHHPTMLVEYGWLTITWWTHVMGGLHKNDFIMAAKTDQLIEDLR